MPYTIFNIRRSSLQISEQSALPYSKTMYFTNILPNYYSTHCAQIMFSLNIVLVETFLYKVSPCKYIVLYQPTCSSISDFA